MKSPFLNMLTGCGGIIQAVYNYETHSVISELFSRWKLQKIGLRHSMKYS